MAYDASHLPPPSKKARHGSAVAASNFRAMKAKLGRQRTAAVHSFCGEVAPGSSGQECAAWCLKSTGDPGPPPTSMVLWDRDRGGSTLVEPSSGAGFRGTTCFLEGDMISRAASLAAQGEGVVVLNMANRHRPGGGFLTAARAQEEQLCHRSDLFPRLKLLLRHANQYYYILPGTAVLTPEVALRLQGKEGGFAPLDDPACVSVVSAAADNNSGARTPRGAIPISWNASKRIGARFCRRAGGPARRWRCYRRWDAARSRTRRTWSAPR